FRCYTICISQHEFAVSVCASCCLSLLSRSSATSSLFPYTTLFRSHVCSRAGRLLPARSSCSGERRMSHDRSPRRYGWDLCKGSRSEEHTSELQSRFDLVCRLLLEKTNESYKTSLI